MDFDETNPRCNKDCPLEWMGDKECDIECYSEECWYDLGDCAYSFCAEDCLYEWLGDGVCDWDCYKEDDCDNDASDCDDVTSWIATDTEFCNGICDWSWVGDGYCDEDCFVSECGSDLNDCSDQCAYGCLNEWISNGKCDFDCYNSNCSYDGTDCTEYASTLDTLIQSDVCGPANFSIYLIGNGVCDVMLLSSDCLDDLGDCDGDVKCADYCIDFWVGDGHCDVTCLNEACNNDGGDCSDDAVEVYGDGSSLWCSDDCYIGDIDDL